MPRKGNFSRTSQLAAARTKRVRHELPSDTSSRRSASERKLALCQHDDLDHGDMATQQWLLFHIAELNEIIRDLICPHCAASGLRITIDPKNQGFCSSVMLECHSCGDNDAFRRSVYTSPRLQGETRGDVAFDVNTRMVLLAHELGLGYAALKKMSKVLGIPGFHLKSYQRHDRRVTGRLWKNNRVQLGYCY